MEVAFCHGEIGLEEEKLLLSIIKYFETLTQNKVTTSICNYQSVRPTSKTKYAICFGAETFIIISTDKTITCYQAPLLYNMLTGSDIDLNKQKLIDIFNTIIESLDEKETTIAIQKNNILFGPEGDIKISEEEVNYLIKLRDLLNGGEIIIKKGEYQVTIKEKTND